VRLPLLLLFFSPCFSFLFLPEQRLRDGHGACGMRLTPVGCRGLSAGAVVLASPTPSFFFRSSGFSFSPSSSPSCGGQGGSPRGGGAVQGGRVGQLLVGAAPRVWGSRAGGRDSVQGRVEAIRRRQHSRAVAMGAGTAGVAPCPAPPSVRHGEDKQGDRDKDGG
jgi:hypothetical protein